jgi:Phage P22-like portal protein
MAKQDKTETYGESPMIKAMMERWNLSNAAEGENRKKFVYAKKFALGGVYQWDDAILNQYKTDNKPHDTYNQIPQFTHQITNDGRLNETETKFIPGNDDMKETAEKREDLARNIQADPQAQIAYDTALENCVEGGWGYWRYITEYENKNSFDQVIKIVWIPNPLVIYDDPNCIRPDRLDRQFLFQTSDMPKSEFKKKYPDKESDCRTLTSTGDSSSEWMGDDYVRIAEYWEVEETITKLYRNKGTGKITEEEPKKIEAYDTRDVVNSKVIYRKCTAYEELEKSVWPGEYIPYVFTAGEEKNVDGKKHLTGLVEHMMAPQRAFNYQSNSIQHMTALAPKSPWIASIRAIKGLEQFWDQSNIRDYAYLPFNDFDDKGRPVAPPSRIQAGVDLSAGVALLTQAQQNFYNTTGIYPASLGQQGNEQSGRAIIARQREGDVSTYHYIDNQTRGKLAGGIILNDLITHIYDGSRIVTGMKADKKIVKFKINQKYKTASGEEKIHDMTIGSYDVMVTTGASYSTKRQEQGEAMLELAAKTDLMQVAPDIFYGTQDWPGADKIAKRYAERLGLDQEDEENPNPIPPAIQQQIVQMQEVIQQMGEALKAADQAVQDKEADIALKQVEFAAKMKELQSGNQTEAMKAANEAERLRLEGDKIELEKMKLELEGDKIDLDAMKAKIDFRVSQNQALQPTEAGGEEMAAIPTNQKEALLAQIMALEEQEAQAAAQAEAQMMKEQQKALAEAQREAEEKMKSELLLQTLAAMSQQIQVLTAAIAAPKQVVRDENGMIQGVVTGGVQ